MDRVGIGMIAILTVISATPVLGAPSQAEMIEQRYEAEVEDLREENQKLREQLNQLKSGRASNTDNPQADSNNSELRARLNQYRQTLLEMKQLLNELPSLSKDDQLATGPSSDEDSDQDSSEDSPVSSTGKDDSTQVSPPDEAPGLGAWVMEGREYPVRRTPIRKEITIVTDSDDTLSKIAHQYYRDADLWHQLYLINQSKLSSPDTLPPGTTLRLPPLASIQSN